MGPLLQLQGLLGTHNLQSLFLPIVLSYLEIVVTLYAKVPQSDESLQSLLPFALLHHNEDLVFGSCHHRDPRCNGCLVMSPI